MTATQGQINLLKGAGDIMNIGGDVVSGIGTMEAYDYNASMAEISASEAAIEGMFEQEDLDTEETSLLSTQRAMYAKAGVTMSGSPMEVALGTATNYEMEKSIAKYNNEILQSKYESQAAQDKYAGQMAMYGMFSNIGKDLLGAGADIAGAKTK